MRLSDEYINSLLHHSLRLDRELRCGFRSHQCGDACVPKSKKCRLPVKPTSDRAKLVLAKEESRIRNQKYETVIAIDPETGKVLFRKDGHETGVNIDRKDIPKMQGAIVTHNHPKIAGSWEENYPGFKGVSFSDADVSTACITQVAEMRAVSVGYNHSLKPPEEGWDAQFWHRKVKPIYRKHERLVYSELMAAIYMGKKDAYEAEQDYHHEIIRRTAEETGMKYRRTNV